MLRIDETAKTLMAPQAGGFVPEAPPERAELLHLLATGWQAFAAELGQLNLHYLAHEPEPGIDLLAFDDRAGRISVVLVGENGRDLLGGAMLAGGEVAGWDAKDLAEVHAMLKAAVPGDSPRLMLVATAWDAETVAAMDWMTRRHGLEVSAYTVGMMRFGTERLMTVERAYPAPEAPVADAAAQFFAHMKPAISPTPTQAIEAVEDPASSPPPVPAS
jgi:hypothetical protein